MSNDLVASHLMFGSTALGRIVVTKSLPNRYCGRASLTTNTSKTRGSSPNAWLPVLAHEAAELQVGEGRGMPLRNGSSERRHATATEGKVPHWLPVPKREEPSRRRDTLIR